jgi:signal transduction histidine kinase
LLLSLHTPTILFVTAAVGLAGSILLFRNGAGRRGKARQHALPSAWAAAALAQALASLGNALRGQIPDVVAFSVVNAAQLFAVALVWEGAARLHGRRLPAWAAAIVPLGWLLAGLIPGFLHTPPLRLGAFTLLACGLVAATVVDLHAIRRRDGLRSAMDLAAMLGFVGVAVGASNLQVLLLGRPDGAWLAFTYAGSLVTALYGTTLPFLILAVARERELSHEHASHAAAIEAERAQVERLHAGLPAVIYLRDIGPDGTSRLLYRGGDVTSVTGWPAAGPDGALVPDPRLMPDESVFERHRRTVLATGSARDEWELPQPEGGRRTMRTTTRLLRQLPGGTVETVGYTVDVTAERQAEAREAAARRLTAIGQVGAGLAHGLLQPLQALTLAAEGAALANEAGDTATTRRKIETVLSQAQRGAALLHHLQRFARGAPDDAASLPVCLAEPVTGALALARFALDEVGAKVEVALGTPAPLVMGDMLALEQVVLTLLLNARDAVADRPRGAARRITVTAAKLCQDKVELRVADTGGGIAAAVLPHLFEPFTTTKSPDEGIGLGLASARGLVRQFGGDLQGRNDAEGAVFTLHLLAAAVSGEPGRCETAKVDSTPKPGGA